MSQVESEYRKEKTKEDYSRNVKKLKVKLATLQNQIITLQKKVDSLTNISNDKLISMKIVKFCKQRRFTPQMLFRFADKKCSKSVQKIAFRQTLTMLGLKLSKGQFLRLEYLIDEDLSGEISYEEYNGYLDAFGIKKEFSPGDQMARQIMQKIDLSKVLEMVEENKQEGKQNKNKEKKHTNLLNYEEFIKYCHKHFPGLKNKELASIFNRLEKNQLINLQDLIDFLQNQQAQKKRLQEKNKRKNHLKIRRQDSFMRSFGDGDKSLKKIIQGLFRYRTNDNTILFHSIQFSRLQKMLNTKRGELLALFQEIDKRKKGSFTHNELISYLTIKFKDQQDLLYIFEIMGHKLKILNHSPQTILSQYSSQPDFLTQKELIKFLQSQFELKDVECKIIMEKLPRDQNGLYSIQSIVELMRRKDGKSLVFIKPNMVVSKLVFKNGRNALKCCLQIEDKLIKKKQAKWDDYQFGPITGDQSGVESISLHLPSQKVDWLRCDQLGMNQFFKQNLETTYSCGSVCPDETLAKSLFWLISLNPQVVYSKDKADSTVRDIQQGHLQHIFKGIYPQVFHPFAKYGIYVIKLFIEQKWKYVIIDDKIPCSSDKNPYFCGIANKRYSFMSLIEKAYAKVAGSYESIYSNIHSNKYILQLSGMLPIQYKFQDNMVGNVKDQLWQGITKYQGNLQKMIKSKERLKLNYLYAMKRMRNDKITNEFVVNKPIRIEHAVELPDNKCKNSHKSHRLMLLRVEQPLKQESEWNKSWNREAGKNKYAQMSLQLADKISEPSVLKSKSVVLLNYKLFRSIFSLFRYEPVNFNSMIILRKQIQFQQKNKCRYEITAKSQLEVVIVLAQNLTVSNSRIVFDIKNEKDQIVSHQTNKGQIAVSPIKIQEGKTVIAELFVDNWQANIQYNYSLTFYMQHGRYQLKQRDRHLLFRFVSPYDQEPKFVFSDFQNEEKQFIYRNFYRAAERRGCCG